MTVFWIILTLGIISGVYVMCYFHRRWREAEEKLYKTKLEAKKRIQRILDADSDWRGRRSQ